MSDTAPFNISDLLSQKELSFVHFHEKPVTKNVSKLQWGASRPFHEDNWLFPNHIMIR